MDNADLRADVQHDILTNCQFVAAENSIKQMERERRGAGEITASHLVSGAREVPNYRLFLKGSANKAALAAFVSDSLTMKAPTRLKNDQTIVLAGGFSTAETVKLVNKTGVTTLPQLFSSQEEADTRLVLHAINLSKTHSRVIICCDDTDVLVILLYFHSKGSLASEVYMHAGHSGGTVTRERYIPVHAIAAKLSDSICLCLPAVHALTGCDTTSALFTIGKRTAFTKLSQHFANVRELSQFGVTLSVSDALDVARRFVLLLYGQKARQCGSLNALRFTLASTSDKEAAMLPPTDDAFKQHVLRAMLQTAVWCHSDIAKPNLPGPVGHGWMIDDERCLRPNMYEMDCAPVEVRDTTHLFCQDADCVTSAKCQCVTAGLPCIELCSCSNCPNRPVVNSFEFDTETEDED